MSAPRDHHIDVPGGRLFAREWLGADAAPPIVLLHDSLGCVDLWRDFPAALAAATGRRVVAYDRLGFGRSDAHPDKLTLDFIAAEGRVALPIVLETLGVETFVLCGHSVGGGMALSAAPNFPDRCKAVIAMAAQAFVENVTLDGIHAARATLGSGSERVERLRKYHGAKTDWVIAAWIETWTRPEFADWSLKPVLPNLRCPGLVMHGDKDEYGSLRHPEMIREFAGGPMELAILTNCGHVPYKERPLRVFELTAAFLKDGL
ncbi:MAG: alpha/beta fold hydrolase [Rhodospirillaceae bacterium]